MAEPIKRCFIIMPVATPSEWVEQYMGDKEHFQHVLAHLFVPAVERAGFEPIRPIMSGSDVIHAEIIRNLETCDMVLCDMSLQNPNVFFELGIRVAVDKPVCLVKDAFVTKVPFDTTLINHLTYDHTLSPWVLPNEILNISQHIKNSEVSGAGRNTLWKYFGLTSRAELPSNGSIDEKLGLIIQFIEENKKGQLYAGVSVRENDHTPSVASMNDLLIAANRAAREVSAQISVHEIGPNRIVFDLGEYSLPPQKRRQIAQIGAINNIKVVFLENRE